MVADNQVRADMLEMERWLEYRMDRNHQEAVPFHMPGELS